MIDLGPELLDWIDRLYQIDAEWRVREERSLTWWPFVFRQQIVADIPQESFGEDVTRLTATTPLLTNVPDDDVTYKLLLGMNYLATFSAIIYEPERSVVQIRTAASFYPGNRGWLGQFFASAAILQVAVPHGMDPEPFTDGRLGTFDVVPHPTSGQRMTPDDMLNVVSLYQGAGRGLNVIDARVYKVAAAGLEASGLEVSVEKTALEIRVPATRLSGASTIHIDDSPHPGFGNGLFVLLKAPEIPGSPDIPGSPMTSTDVRSIRTSTASRSAHGPPALTASTTSPSSRTTYSSPAILWGSPTSL